TLPAAQRPATATTKLVAPRRLGVTEVPRAQVKAMIIATARKHGVDPKLALAVGWQESGWQQNVLSSADAYGIMQVIPSSGQWASAMVGRTLDLRKPQDNVTAGVVILRTLGRMATNRDQAIAGYYQGLGSVRSKGLYDDTKQYVRSVNAILERMWAPCRVSACTVARHSRSRIWRCPPPWPIRSSASSSTGVIASSSGSPRVEWPRSISPSTPGWTVRSP
ncbi:MAG: transglycosylase SLT domain-containing protein, partial [Nostocoides sp.]